jgi:small subunit ribosomal protein S6
MQQKYELMILFKPLLVEDIKGKSFPKVEDFIKKLGGSVAKAEIWGKRLLAYPIGKYKEGNYVVSKISLDPTSATSLSKNLGLNDSVLRYLLIKEEDL